LWVALTLFVGACATPSGPPPETEKRLSTAPGRTYPNVFGKFDLLKDGEPQKIAWLSWSGITEFHALVLPEGASRALILDVDEQGWFYWKLAPGNYTLLGFVFRAGQQSTTGHVNARFTAATQDSATYIGHIRLEVGKGQSALGFRDAEQDAVVALKTKWPDALQPVRKQLLAPETKIGEYRTFLPICAKAWRIQCSRDLQGIEPVFPALQGGLRGTTFTPITEVQPTMRWKALAGEATTYDLVIWEAVPYQFALGGERYISGPLVTYLENLDQPEIQLNTALKPKTKYFWSVRLRRGDMVSTWSTAGHFTFLIVAWTSGRGESFAFETP